VRSFDSDRLILANPGGTGPRFGQQSLDRADFEQRGPFSAVWIDAGEPAPTEIVSPTIEVAGTFRVVKTDGAGVNLRQAPDASARRVKTLAEGSVVQGEAYAWRRVRDADGAQGWVADAYLGPADVAPHEPTDEQVELTDEPDYRFGFAALWPHIQTAAEAYGADAQLLAAIMAQESGFTNWRVHQDGTGHGLFGLDDNGLLPDFEQWSGLACGRGRSAISIPPKPQIAYCARTIAALTRQYGTAYDAARVWHRGPGLWRDKLGDRYEQLIRGHVAALQSGLLAETFQ
jgi:hypothetical protein